MIRLNLPYSVQPRGPAAADLVRFPNLRLFYPNNGKATPVSTVQTSVTGGGIGYNGGSTTSIYWRGYTAADEVLGALDMFTFGGVLCSTQAAIAGGYTMLGERQTGNDIVKISFSESSQSTNSFGLVVRNTAGSLSRINGTRAVNDGKPHTVVVAKRASNDWQMWIDGISAGTLTTDYPASAFTNANPLTIGNDLVAATNINAITQAFVHPGVAWTETTVRQHAINPWILLKPISKSIVYDVGSAPAASNAPRYYHRTQAGMS